MVLYSGPLVNTEYATAQDILYAELRSFTSRGAALADGAGAITADINFNVLEIRYA